MEAGEGGGAGMHVRSVFLFVCWVFFLGFFFLTQVTVIFISYFCWLALTFLIDLQELYYIKGHKLSANPVFKKSEFSSHMFPGLSDFRPMVSLALLVLSGL